MNPRPPICQRCFVDAVALGGVHLGGEHQVRREVGAERLCGVALPEARVVGLHLAHDLGSERGVVGRDRIARRALEDGEVRGLLGDQRDRLDRRRSGADHRDALAGEVDAAVRPAPGVIGLARERVAAREVGHVRGRQAARRHDQEARGDAPAIGLDRPAALGVAPVRGAHARVELDVAAQIEAVGDVLDVAQDLGLGRVALAPLPFLLELLRELIGVFEALDVAARAGIAVPVPGAADPAAAPRTRAPRSRACAGGGA